MTTRSKNLYSSLFFFWLGIVICIGAWTLGVGKIRTPGAGFMPFVTGAVISGISLLLFFSTLIERRKEEGEIKDIVEKKEKFRRIGLIISVLLFSFLFMQALGFGITIWISFFILLRFIEPQKWTSSLFMSLLITAGFYFAFQVLLQVPFPKGILGF